MALDLEQLIDLEVQLHLDRDEDPSALLERDRGIDVQGRDRLGLLVAWVDARRDAYDGLSPGQRFARAARLSRALLSLAGFGVGWGVAATLMHYDGTRPINVLSWIAVAVLLQVVTVLVSVFGLAALRITGRTARLPLVADVRALVRSLLRFFSDRFGRRFEGDRADELRVVLGRMRGRNGLYREQEGLVAFEVVQWLGIAFNIGLLVGAFRLVALSDLAFAWSTTLEVGPAAMHRFVSLLAAPWAWAVSAAAPTTELVEATRFTRFEGAFSAEVGAAVAGQWWHFLLAATLVYGLLPRMLLLGLGRRSLSRSLARVPLDTPEVDRLVNRIGTPSLSVEMISVDDGDPSLPDQPDLPSLAPVARAGHAIRWGSFPGDDAVLRGALARDLAVEASVFHHAGGRDYREDAAAAERIAADHSDRIAVLVEAFDEPDRAFRRLLEDLRAAVGQRVPIIVGVFSEIDDEGVVAPARVDLKRWSSMVRAEGDPFVDVLPLGDNRE